MLIRSIKLQNVVCFACLFSCDLVRAAKALGPGDKDIPGYRSSGKIRVASGRCTIVLVAPLAVEKILTHAFSSALSRFFVR